MTKVKVISCTKRAYNSAVLGARILKRRWDVFFYQKMALREIVMVKVTMTFRTASLSMLCIT